MKALLITTLVLVSYAINTAQENLTDCQIVRVVEFPLTKKPGVETEPKIALLDICLNDKVPRQRPVVEVIRRGKKEFREFEVIKTFARRAEAENYVREKGLLDADYGQPPTDKKQQLPNLRPFNDFYTKLAAFVRSGEIDLDKNYRIKVKGEILNERFYDWKLYLPEQDNRDRLLALLDDFARAVNESRIFQVVALKELDESIKTAEIDINLEGEKANFVFRFQTNSAGSAAKIANRFKLLFAAAGSVMKNQPGVEFYKNAAFEIEKDRLFFSTSISRRNLALYLRDW